MIPTGWLIQRGGRLGVLQVFGRESEVPFENKVKLEKSESQQWALLVSPNPMGLGAAIWEFRPELKKMDLTSSCFCSAAQPCLTLSDPMDCSNRAPLSSTISQSLLTFMSILSGASLTPNMSFPISVAFCSLSLELCMTQPNWTPGGPGKAQVPLYQFNNTHGASVTRQRSEVFLQAQNGV